MKNLRTSGISTGHRSKQKLADQHHREDGKLTVIDTLASQTDILCLQEHWLHRFEEARLADLATQHGKGYALKCYDDSEPLPPAQRLRGQAGVATLWNTELTPPDVTVLPDGANNILAITIQPQAPSSERLCIINAYMPCRGNHTEIEYQNSLNQVPKSLQNLAPHTTLSSVET